MKTLVTKMSKMGLLRLELVLGMLLAILGEILGDIAKTLLGMK